MTEREFQAVRTRFERFVKQMFRDVPYSPRRYWAQVHAHGLLLEGRRKSCGAIAYRLGEEDAEAREQSLQQFLYQSPWEWEPVRRRLAQAMVKALGPGGGWIFDDTAFPKKGSHSVGVARQHCGTLGKQDNCQVGVSLSYATAKGAMPLDFALYLPEEWVENPARRKEAKLPEEVVFKTKGELALEGMDRLLKWGLPQPEVVVADADYGRPTHLREALKARRLQYVLAVEGKLVAWREPRGKRPESLQAIAHALPPEAWKHVTWREGTTGKLSSRFARVRVQTATQWEKGRQPGSEEWLLIEWPEAQEEPENYWLSNLPQHLSLRKLVFWAKSRWAIEQNYQEMKQHLGLEHCEGRSWQGWHHHVTMVLLALAFVLTERLRQAEKGGEPYQAFPRSWDGSRNTSASTMAVASAAAKPAGSSLGLEVL